MWAFACSPAEISKEILQNSYEVILFIKENGAFESLEIVIPELKELCRDWDNLSQYEKGNKTGYIIGKYGLDVLAPGAIIKGIKQYQNLKRINSLFTIECCVESEAKMKIILERSAQHTSVRTIVSESARVGKIIPQNPNVAAHVLQKKHAWEKVIKLTGDTNKDFESVIKFLENNNIFKGAKENLGSFPRNSSSKINRYKYTIKVNNQTVQAEFIEYIETKEFYFNDAWVKIYE